MYRQAYRRKLTTLGQAVAPIKDSATIMHGMANGEPPALLAAIANRVRQGDLKDLHIFTFLAMANAAATILSPDLAGLIHNHCWFVTGAERDQVRTGKHLFVPNQFHQIPRLIRDFMEVDVTVTTVSPMDRSGFFSFGTVNDFITTAARHCRRLIVEVNRHMPRVFGDSLLHVSEVDAIVEHDAPLAELIPAAPKPEAETIGRHIAANDNMISINSTLEVDLLGQCNSEYLGGFEFSGTGGQLDYVRGAFNSKGGKSIIAFYSTTHGGEVSRVVPRFAAGTVTTTPRMDTHYLVTEYGAVNLMGKSTCERANEIVKLAHPKFRDSLMEEARKMCLA